MKVFVTSKKTFDDIMLTKGITNDNVESYDKAFLISINDSVGTDEVPYFENKENVKVLFFHDLDEDIETKSGTANTFTYTQAEELLEFIDKHKDKETCIVHCAAGVSRSGAVGTFINDYFGGDWFEFKKTNPHINPNARIIALLNEAVRNKNK